MHVLMLSWINIFQTDQDFLFHLGCANLVPKGFQMMSFLKWLLSNMSYKYSHPEVFLEKGVLKICSKFTIEHPCRSTISIKLQSNFIEVTLRHGCSPVNLLHIFTTLFFKNTFEWLLLVLQKRILKLF